MCKLEYSTIRSRQDAILFKNIAPDRSGTFEQEVGSRPCFWESNNVSDRLCATQYCHYSI